MITERRSDSSSPRSASAQVQQQGKFVLFALYIALLAGRFSIARFNEGATSGFRTDLRWILLILLVLLVLFWLVTINKTKIRRDSLVGFAPFSLWCGWLAISSFWAPDAADTSSSLSDIFFLFTFAALAWFTVAHLDLKILDQVWTWVLITGLIYFFLALISGPDIQGRFAAPGGGPNTFVRIMVVSAMAALYLVNEKSKKWPIFTFPLFLIGAILSGSRGGVLSGILIGLVFLVPLIRILKFRGVLSLLTLGSFSLVAASFWREGYVLEMIENRFIERTLVDGYASGRDMIIYQAWDMFLAKPLTGVGLDGFGVLEAGPAQYHHAHNLFLSSLAEAGLIGATLLVFAIIYLVIRSLPGLVASKGIYYLMAGIYFLSASMFSGDYYDSRFVWFFLALAAVTALRVMKISRDAPRSNSPRLHKHRSTN